MGHRTLKRVPMDFAWPMNKVWEGYLNPYYRKCPDCENGQTAAGSALEHLVHLILIAGDDSVRGTVHPWLIEAGVSSLSSDMSELSVGLAGRSPSPFGGHDACDRWSATKAIVKAAGLDPEKWGICKTCGGDAIDPAVKGEYKAWTEQEPPTGDGFQLWETCSEGSPVSPVFATADALAEWCSKKATTFASLTATKDQWLKMFVNDSTDVGTMFVVSEDGRNGALHEFEVKA